MRFRALAFDYHAEAVFVAEQMERRRRRRDSASTTTSDESEGPTEGEDDLDLINSPFSPEELTAQAMRDDDDDRDAEVRGNARPRATQ
jgi:hypothetical protein